MWWKFIILRDSYSTLEDQQECSKDLENSTLSVANEEDLVAVEMCLEHSSKEKEVNPPIWILVRMPQKACVKVEHYRSEDEILKDKMTKHALEHRQQLDQANNHP